MVRTLATLAGVFILASGIYYADAQTKPAAKPKTTSSISPVVMERGKIVYEKECLPCHQVGGNGVQRMNPPLIKTKYVLGDKKSLIAVVVKGLDKPIEIDGETYENIMPAHPNLTDQEIADVLTYVRNSFGNKASAVSASEVKSVKAKIK
jgi:mono/diheme cytochrome c family protein